MVGRNQKGQILIESVVLMTLFVSLIFVLQNIIVRHQQNMNQIRLSTELNRGYKNEITSTKFKNQSAK